MPELPEVETLRRQLDEVVLGTTITAVTVIGHRTVRRQPPEAFIGRMVGRTIVGTRRWGKFLLVDLDDAEVFVVHLRMSGQLHYVADPNERQPAHTHGILSLSSGGELRFVDPRTFGELFITEGADDRGLPPEIAHLGIDPVCASLTEQDLRAIVAHRNVAIKTVLLDQRRIAGIGNIYGDEICFRAKVRPTRPAASLTRPERERLVVATRDVLTAAIRDRGSTLADQQYRDLTGELGRYQDHHDVYGRAGMACHRCGTAIVRVIVGGRAAHYCPKCQR